MYKMIFDLRLKWDNIRLKLFFKNFSTENIMI